MKSLDWKSTPDLSSPPPAAGNIWFAVSLALTGLIAGFIVATLFQNGFIVQAEETEPGIQVVAADPVPADAPSGGGCGMMQ